jgi:hypothetical protein
VKAAISFLTVAITKQSECVAPDRHNQVDSALRSRGVELKRTVKGYLLSGTKAKEYT